MTATASTALERLGLRRSPFPHTPDAAAYYATAHLRGELGEALQCLRARSGFVLLTGEVGTGKSTFLRRLLEQAGREGLVSSLVFNTFLQGAELLAAILRDFGLEPCGSMAGDVETLNRFLLELWRNGHGCVLVIDDAQNLDLESLELLRLLTSIETGQEKLLQIVLAGQPELCTLLEQPRIRQLTSRIVKHVRLAPLRESEILDYVRFRLDAAGAGPDIVVEPEAATALLAASKGNPRRIHLVMERCLYGLLALDTRRIDASLVRTAAAEAGVQRGRPRRLPAVPRPPIAVTASVMLVLLSAALGAWSRTGSPSPQAGIAVPAPAWQAACDSWLGELMPDDASARRCAGAGQAHWTMLAPAAALADAPSPPALPGRRAGPDWAWPPPGLPAPAPARATALATASLPSPPATGYPR